MAYDYELATVTSVLNAHRDTVSEDTVEHTDLCAAVTWGNRVLADPNASNADIVMATQLGHMTAKAHGLM